MDYPYDLVTCKRKKSTLSVEAHYVYEDKESPLKVFHPKFSLYKISLIDAGEGASYFTIHMEDIPGIEKRTDVAATEYFRPKPVDEETNKNPAFTTRFFAGNLKGKTPAEILAEDPENGGTTLNNQYKWLKENLEQYPKNKALIDAIIAASKLTAEEISAAGKATVNCAPVQIIKVGCRPLTRNKREDGKCFCYEGSITWDISKDYPVSVTAKNYYAPVVQKEDGTLNVSLNEKDKASEKVRVFNLTADEWLNVVSELKFSKEAFRTCNFSRAVKAAEAAGEANRQAAKIA